MKLKNKKNLFLSLGFLAAFVIWTVLVKFVNVLPIGPEGTSVGFASLNGGFHELTGVHWWLYDVTDWLGLVPFAVAAAFGILGLIQLIKRKSLLKVDPDILILGVFYVVVIAVYLMFEVVVINYRPVMPEGRLEVSYPSSTTMLVACVIPTAIMQLSSRIKDKALKWGACLFLAAFTAFMVIGRLVSGVHWLSDIIGGALLSTGMVLMYHTLANAEFSAKKA